MERSRHLEVIFATVARDFIRADAEGLGVGVAVTYGGLMTARARRFRQPVLRRYQLSDLESIRLRHGNSVGYLLIEIGGRQPTTVMILYGIAAAADFERVVAVVGQLSRRRRSSTQGQRKAARRNRSPV